MHPMKIQAAKEAVDMLTAKSPGELIKSDVEGVYHMMQSAYWKDEELPDLLKAIAVWDSDHDAALGYLFSASKQGNPIENEFPEGGGGGVVKDINKMLETFGYGSFGPRAMI